MSIMVNKNLQRRLNQIVNPNANVVEPIQDEQHLHKKFDANFHISSSVTYNNVSTKN